MADRYFRDKPLEIGFTRQLVFDDLIVEDAWRLKRVLHQPLKWFKNPVIYKTEPWEAEAVGHPSVFYDKDFGCFRMWYMCFSPSNYFSQGKEGKIHYMCNVESKDVSLGKTLLKWSLITENSIFLMREDVPPLKVFFYTLHPYPSQAFLFFW